MLTMSEYLFDTTGIFADMLSNRSVYFLTILLRRELDQEIPCINVKQRWQ